MSGSNVPEKNEVAEAVKRMAEFTALLYYHLTKAVIEDFGDEAKESIRRGVRNFGHERGRNIAREVREAGEALTIENLDRFYDMPIKAGWSPGVKYEGGRKFNQTDTCTFAQVWLDKDWREVGAIYCDVDPAIREGYSDNVVYRHEKVILEGDDCCTSVTEYRDKSAPNE